MLWALPLPAGQPALSSFIPPSVDSLILDYQSPNANPGFYPNEANSSGGIGTHQLLRLSRRWSLISLRLTREP